jgi:hypothetical protein
MIAFKDYAKIKNNYCLCYFGQCDEYLLILDFLRPKILEKFPGINFFIGCKDSSCDVLKNSDYVLSKTSLKVKKREFAHINEIHNKSDGHSIEDLLKDCDIEDYTLRENVDEPKTVKAVIVNESSFPTSPMIESQLNRAEKIAEAKGFEVAFDGDWENSGLVIGVESPELVRAAMLGIPTIIADTGVGTNFYKKLFPSMEIL